MSLVTIAREAGVEQFVYTSFAPLAASFPLQDAKRTVERALRASGLTYTIRYRRGRSATQAIFDALKIEDPYTFIDLLDSPIKARGAPSESRRPTLTQRRRSGL